MSRIYHTTAYFIWTDCRCGKRMVRAVNPEYKLQIEDAHLVFDLTPVIFYPEHYFQYEDGCLPASWHIIPAWPADAHA